MRKIIIPLRAVAAALAVAVPVAAAAQEAVGEGDFRY